MKPITTRTKILRAAKQLPMLTDFGLGVPYGTKIKQRRKAFKVERTKLLSSTERFEAACEWFKDVEKTVHINPRHNSYFLKHIAERSIDGHLSNGVFIVAAIHCGFDVVTAKYYPNVLFNIDEESIKDKHAESLLHEKNRSDNEVELICNG